MADQSMPHVTFQSKKDLPFIYILLASFAVRLILATLTSGYKPDLSCFLAWGEKALEGLPSFYSEGYFADYTPGYIYVLALIAALRNFFHIDYYARASMVLLVLVPSVCDAALSMLIYRMGRRHMFNQSGTLRLAAFAAFCPMLIFDTAIWKQIDGVFMLPILICLCLLENKKYYRAAVSYGIALAIKPQALLLGPVLAIAFIVPVINATRTTAKTHQKGRAVGAAFIRIPAGIVFALLPVLLSGIPFFGLRNLVPSLIDKYTQTAASYPYASVDAFNFFALLGGNWADQSQLLLGLPWQTWGTVNLIILTMLLVFLTIFMMEKKRFSPVLLAAFYTAGIFTFSHRMHERYLVMGVLIALLAAAWWDDLALMFAASGLSLVSFLNIACVYAMADTDDSFLMSDTSQEFLRIVSAVEVIFFLILAVRIWQLARGRKRIPIPDSLPEGKSDHVPDSGDQAGNSGTVKRGTRVAVTRKASVRVFPQKEVQARAGVLILTMAAALLGFVYLGDTTAPQTTTGNYNGTTDISFTIDSGAKKAGGDQPEVPANSTPVTIRLYPEISYDGMFTVTSDLTGDEVVRIPLGYTSIFTWQKSSFAGEGEGNTFTAHITNAKVLEAAVYDADGSMLAVTGGGDLFDEQSLVPSTFSRLNSMYFDEIYHGRTGYEMAHRLNVYETTHPPLGKDFIMAAIMLLGMNAFAWRAAPALFGVLLIPLMYLFTRKLTGSTKAAMAAAAFSVLDFMRYVESRLATIDIFTTFFILLSAYFMLDYSQKAPEKGVRTSWLPAMESGIAFGLGVSVKWNAAYAGIGLAAVYFLTLYQRWMADSQREEKESRTRSDLAFTLIYGVLFFIGIPFLIYLASYFPYRWRDPSFGLADWWNCQKYMYWYHSTNTATNPFSSNWYTWPLLLRPYWYYADYELPAGMVSSIASVGSVITWTGGMISMLYLFWKQLAGNGSEKGRFLLLFYFGQLLPWILVTRTTYNYHYLPLSTFGIVGLTLVLQDIPSVKARRKVTMSLLIAMAVLFLLFFPILSGLPVSSSYGHALQLLKSWQFYL